MRGILQRKHEVSSLPGSEEKLTAHYPNTLTSYDVQIVIKSYFQKRALNIFKNYSSQVLRAKFWFISVYMPVLTFQFLPSITWSLPLVQLNAKLNGSSPYKLKLQNWSGAPLDIVVTSLFVFHSPHTTQFSMGTVCLQPQALLSYSSVHLLTPHQAPQNEKDLT